MSQALIRQAFEVKLAAWAAAQSPAIPVAYENANFTPPTSRYARAFVLPGESTTIDLECKARRYVGVFQVSLFLPIGEGAGAAGQIVASLDTAFSPHTPLTAGGLEVWLTSPMSAGPAQQEADRYIVPVSCRYTANE